MARCATRVCSLLAALVGAYLVASLPLLDVHVALAGYADLMMACVYTLAALAFYRWTLAPRPARRRLALLLALCLPADQDSRCRSGR